MFSDGLSEDLMGPNWVHNWSCNYDGPCIEMMSPLWSDRVFDDLIGLMLCLQIALCNIILNVGKMCQPDNLPDAAICEGLTVS